MESEELHEIEKQVLWSDEFKVWSALVKLNVLLLFNLHQITQMPLPDLESGSERGFRVSIHRKLFPHQYTSGT
jgi:hypothetical protein